MPSEQPFAAFEVVEFGQFIAVKPFCVRSYEPRAASTATASYRHPSPRRSAPRCGTILGEAGFSASDIDAFLAQGVTRDSIDKK